MATYTLIPSSWGGTSSITNPSNAYADTTSTTYAEAAMYSGATQTPAYLGGFDFGTIPQGASITGLTVKVKAARRSVSATCYVALVKSADVADLLSDSQSLTTTETVYTLDLTSSVDTILEYKDTLCLRFVGGFGVTSVYGAEVIVTATLPSKNKIIYGNETLIDLTGDTATASDVASGKTFHLASGLQATGTLSPSVATATTTGSTTRTLSFTNLTKQPSWFMMICSSTNTTARNNRVQHMLYDGTTTTTYYTNSSTAGSIATSTSYGSFSYSSGTLAITVTTAYIGAASWELYYL